jgi:hypothetical protein
MATNIQIRKGDDYTISLDFDEDITGWVVTLTVKDEDGDVVLTKQESTHNDAAEGETSLSISNSESEDLDGTYDYEIVATRSDNTLKGVVSGVVTFADNVLSSDVSITATTSNDSVSVSGGAAGSGAYTWTSDTFTYETDQTNPSMVLTETFVAGTCAVYKNGVLQKKDTNYTEKVDKTGIDWVGTVYSDDEIEVRYAYE